MSLQRVALEALFWSILIVAVALGFAILSGCAVPRILTPPGDTTCGQWPVECGNGTCCYEHEVCGSTPGCPEGMCCYDGDETPAWGKRAKHPMVTR